MAKLNSGTISGRTVDALPVGDRETIFWDRDMAGFGVRVYPTGAKVYLVQVRVGGKTRRVTIGRHGLISAEDARLKAAELISRIKRSKEWAEGPAPTLAGNATTLAEAAERYMREHVAVRCKATTARACRVALENYILPEFGSRSLDAIEPDEVAALHYRLHRTPAMANQVVEVLSRVFYAAESWGVAPESGNPCQFGQEVQETKLRTVPFGRGVPQIGRRASGNGG